MMNHDPHRSKALFRTAFMLALLPLMACSSSQSAYDDSNSPAAGMVQLATQIRARGDNAGAIDFYLRALQIDPNDAAAHKGLAEAYELTGRQVAAVEEYKKLIILRPDDGEVRRNLGRVFLALEQPADARDAYQGALDLDSGDVKALNGMGIALDYLGNHDLAQKNFKRALREEPENLKTLNNLAYSTILDNNYGEAIRLLEPHIKDPGATPGLRQNLALAYGLAGMEADAERVAKMDLPEAKVKENLAYYKRRRAEQVVSTAPYAEVGSYATQAMAEAQIAQMQQQIEGMGIDLKPVIAPQVAAPGGTPRFEVRMMGCARASDVQVFCSILARNGLPCMVRGGR